MVDMVWCVARGNEANGWDALCVDLDIAVHGPTFDSVRESLNHAINTYVEDALNEEPHVRRALLSRRAPWHVRLKWGFQFFLFSLFGKHKNHNQRAGFDILCPA